MCSKDSCVFWFWIFILDSISLFFSSFQMCYIFSLTHWHTHTKYLFASTFPKKNCECVNCHPNGKSKSRMKKNENEWTKKTNKNWVKLKTQVSGLHGQCVCVCVCLSDSDIPIQDYDDNDENNDSCFFSLLLLLLLLLLLRPAAT